MGLDLQRQSTTLGLKVVVCLAMLGWMLAPGGCASPGFMFITLASLNRVSHKDEHGICKDQQQSFGSFA
jgi:hypothetical protein